MIASAAIAATMVLLASATSVLAGRATTTVSAPYKGGILPATTVQVASCAKTGFPVPMHFKFRTGSGGASAHATAHSCPASQYRLGDYSSASASRTAELSFSIVIPPGVHNVSANLALNWSGTVAEHNGSSSGHCPTTPFSSVSGQYWNGSARSYIPSVSGPRVFTNKTYWYEYNQYGASGSCTSQSQMYAGISGFMLDWNGTASTSLTPSSTTIIEELVSTDNSTYWSCYNYTLWNYGAWANATPSCSGSNTTAYSWSYDSLTNSYRTSQNFLSVGSLTFSMWANYNFSTAKNGLLFLDPSLSVSAYSSGFLTASAAGTINMGNLGNGFTLRSITIV